MNLKQRPIFNGVRMVLRDVTPRKPGPTVTAGGSIAPKVEKKVVDKKVVRQQIARELFKSL